MTRGERIIAFIEEYCYVPEGDLVGQKVVLIDFQKEFILSVYDNKVMTKIAMLSIARKNAKTATIAFIVLAHLVGPEAYKNSRIVSGALSREQASEVFNCAAKCVMASPELSEVVRIIPSGKRLVGIPRNVEYLALSADGRRAHGKSPVLAIIDEVGQVRGPNSDFIDAITTSQAAYENALLIYISTQAANDGDLFSILIDDAIKYPRDNVVCRVYAADPDAEIMDEEQWKKANPALGIFRSYLDLKTQAEKASTNASYEGAFRNLCLNQRVSASATWISKSMWEANASPVQPFGRSEVFGGLDLSLSRDLTAFVIIALVNGKWHTKPYFWMPADSIAARSKEDREPYDKWHDKGLLRVTPGKTVNFGAVITDIMDIIDGLNVSVIAYDRYKIEDFKSKCLDFGVEFPLVEFGQGFKDMTVAIESMEDKLANGQVAHGMHPVLTMCIRNAKTVMDDAGGRKISKLKSTGRIDGAVSMAMAFGAHAKKYLRKETPSYKMLVI